MARYGWPDCPENENDNIGCVSVTDTPYPELAAAARSVQPVMDARRFAAAGNGQEWPSLAYPRRRRLSSRPPQVRDGQQPEDQRRRDQGQASLYSTLTEGHDEAGNTGNERTEHRQCRHTACQILTAARLLRHHLVFSRPVWPMSLVPLQSSLRTHFTTSA